MCLTTEQDALLTSLYREMYEKLVNLAYVRLRSVPLAEEAAQETFCIACRRPEAALESPNPQGWLVTTLRYVVRNMERLQSMRDVADPDRLSEIAVYDDHTDAEYSDLLSAAEYRLFRRVSVDRCTMREAAAELGISEEACKKRVQRIRARLQEKILRIRDEAVPESDGGDILQIETQTERRR